MILLVGMGFFGVSFGLPVFFQGLGFVSSKGMGWIRLHWGFYIYQTFRP